LCCVLETEELKVLGAAAGVVDPSGPWMVVAVASSYVGPVKAVDPDATAPANAIAWPLAAVNISRSHQVAVPCAVDLVMVSVLDASD
jgi:hypothetical protein